MAIFGGDDDIVKRVTQLRKEALSVRQDFEPIWDKNFRIYCGDHWDKKSPEGLKQFTLNVTQNANLAIVAIQTEQRPSVRMTPVETNEPPVIFMSPGGSKKLQSLTQSGQLSIEGYDSAMMLGQKPITDQHMQALLSIAAPVDPAMQQQGGAPGAPGAAAGAMGPQPMFGPEDFILIDDRMACDAVSTIHDVMWDRANADFAWVENITNKGVVGHQFMLVQWDDERQLPQYVNLHPKMVWVDPLATAVNPPEYLGYDELVSKEEAKRKYPKLASYIDTMKSGTSNPIGDGRDGVNEAYGHVTFERDMLVIVHAWIYGEKYPIDEQDAVDQGLVQPLMQPVMQPATDPLGQPMLDEAGQPVMQQVGEQQAVSPSGKPMYVSAENKPVMPGGSGWPMERHIRQVTIIGDRVVEDRRCPYDDCPIILNVNIPIPFRPYGQGEPERLHDLQEAINRVASILHNHLKYYQSPMAVLPQSVKNALPKGAATHARPDMEWTIPDELVEQFGRNLKLFIDPPTLPASYIEYFSMLLNIHDKLSGNSEVLQGRTDSNAESGKAIDLLQSAARGIVGFKSLYTELAITHATRLIVGMIRDYLTDQDLARYISGLPVQAVTVLRDRIKRIDFDIRVEIVSGKGTNRRMEQQRAMNEFAAGLRSRISAMKKLEIPDAETEIQQMLNDPLTGVAAMAAAAAPSPDESGNKKAA